MLKLTLKTVQVACLLIGTGVAVAALATRPSPPPRGEALCREGGQWLAVGTQPPQPSTIRDVVAQAVRQDVVLLGEQHDNEDHHRWQLQMLAALYAQRPQMVIGFEMKSAPCSANEPSVPTRRPMKRVVLLSSVT